MALEFLLYSVEKIRPGEKNKSKALFHVDNANISYLPTQCARRKPQWSERCGFPGDLFALLMPAKEKALKYNSS